MAGKSKPNLTPVAFLSKSGAGRIVRDYRNKEVIFSQGDSADAILYLQNGMIKLTVVSQRRRKKAVVAVLQAGDIFNESSLRRQMKRKHIVIAIRFCKATRENISNFHCKL